MAFLAERWWDRMAALRRKGLWATVQVDIAPPYKGTPLLMLALSDVDERQLPRKHAQRGFKLHVSLCLTTEVNSWTDIAELAARWDGRRHLITFDRTGPSGGCSIAAGNLLCRDPLIRRLHSGGLYAGRPLHVSL
jgi:hypothetical protein